MNCHPDARPLKIIVIRRDNIGDLISVTPLIHALREHFPNSHIAALVNHYNEPILSNNPDVDAVYAYMKAKHRAKGVSLISIYWRRLRLFMKLRAERFDYAIIASPHFLIRPLRLARLIRPQKIIGFIEPGKPGIENIDIGLPYLGGQRHRVEELFDLLKPFGIPYSKIPLQFQPDAQALAIARQTLSRSNLPEGKPLIGIHISARDKDRTWHPDNFATLMRRLHGTYQASFILYWSPGAADNPFHPGDDAKAHEMIAGLADIPLLPYPTQDLQALIAGLALPDQVICSDGGAMHIAAALGKPIVCFFGKENPALWHPWGVPHVVLKSPENDVETITAESAFEAYSKLLLQLQDNKVTRPRFFVFQGSVFPNATATGNPT